MTSLWPQLEPLLPRVQKPARYIGCEDGAKAKFPDPQLVSWCFTYPDTYEVGLPNHGLQILYEIVNERPLRPQAVVDAHLRELAAVDLAINCLLFPRNIAIGLPEFATAGARAYFRDKKEGMIRRTFEKALAETAQHRTAVEVALAALPELPLPSRHADTLGLDDVLLYPTLCNLTRVKGLAFPPEVRRYIDEVTALADSHTYFDRAC